MQTCWMCDSPLFSERWGHSYLPVLDLVSLCRSIKGLLLRSDQPQHWFNPCEALLQDILHMITWVWFSVKQKHWSRLSLPLSLSSLCPLSMYSPCPLSHYLPISSSSFGLLVTMETRPVCSFSVGIDTHLPLFHCLPLISSQCLRAPPCIENCLTLAHPL